MVKETQYGLIQAAKRENVKLLFFSSFSNNFSTNKKYTKFTNYDIGDYAIYHLPDLNTFDYHGYLYSGLLSRTPE